GGGVRHGGGGAHHDGRRRSGLGGDGRAGGDDREGLVGVGAPGGEGVVVGVTRIGRLPAIGARRRRGPGGREARAIGGDGPRAGDPRGLRAVVVVEGEGDRARRRRRRGVVERGGVRDGRGG